MMYQYESIAPSTVMVRIQDWAGNGAGLSIHDLHGYLRQVYGVIDSSLTASKIVDPQQLVYLVSIGTPPHRYINPLMERIRFRTRLTVMIDKNHRVYQTPHGENLKPKWEYHHIDIGCSPSDIDRARPCREYSYGGGVGDDGHVKSWEHTEVAKPTVSYPLWVPPLGCGAIREFYY